MTTGKVLVVAAAAILGTLFGVGCLIAAHFELSGFGDRDSDPSELYLAGLAAGFLGCVLVPVMLWRLLLPASAPSWGLAVVPIALGVLAVLGLSVS